MLVEPLWKLVALGLAYRSLVLLGGVAFAFMGYRLFSLGVFQASDVEATWKSNKLLLKKAAPGTVFALFGAVVICVSLWKGFSLNVGPSASTVASSDLGAAEKLLASDKLSADEKEALKRLIDRSRAMPKLIDLTAYIGPDEVKKRMNDLGIPTDVIS